MLNSTEVIAGKRNDGGSKKIFHEFCQTTGADGFNQIANANGQKMTIVFWHIIIFIAFGFLTFHLYTLIDKYLAYNYDETTTLVFESPVFPDITLCNMDPINSFTK